jgi:hypothetical protein
MMSLSLVPSTVNVSHFAGRFANCVADFLRRFGTATTATEIGYAIPPDWQSALSNGSSAGGIIGLLVSAKELVLEPANNPVQRLGC